MSNGTSLGSIAGTGLFGSAQAISRNLRAQFGVPSSLANLVNAAAERLRGPRTAQGVVPQRTDPEIVAASQAAIREERVRKGRAATILTSRRGVQDDLGSASRPQARSGSVLLGGT